MGGTRNRREAFRESAAIVGDILSSTEYYRRYSSTLMAAPHYSVLFLCTGNSCRSIMAEALLNEVGKALFRAYSAGSNPAGFVHPQALACLTRNRIPAVHPHSKLWDNFADTRLDLLVTVCDNAAREACPVYPGAPIRMNWAVPDPALAEGSDAEVAEVFQTVFEGLRTHIELFVKSVTDNPDAKLADIVRALGAPTVSI
jgi:arsenate reductase